MDAERGLFSIAQLRASTPTLGYAYRGLVPGHGRSLRYTPAWFSCWYVDVGRAEVRFEDGRVARAEPGEWLLTPPMSPRYQIFPSGAEILSLAFHMPLPPGVDVDAVLPMRVATNHAADLVAPAMAVVAALGGAHSPAYLSDTVHVDLGRWLRIQQHVGAFAVAWHDRVFANDLGVSVLDPRLRDACTLLAAQARMGAVPYPNLQARTGLGRVHLDRLFKQALGRSPKQELDRLCLQRVLRRLDERARPVKAIAAELGFTDSSHLCRWFAKRTGMSPERYRRTGLV
ncbi:MAG: helix-turn-helix domain-containing protein [Planctomycetota bacterium]|jgi:AraC-like DNA-binding protein|nr:helix-turn-helix domain-containing protein [Planctomycetota bacterium]